MRALPHDTLKSYGLLLLGLLLCAYFSYHLMFGPRSYPALEGLRSDIVRAQADLQTAQGERAELEDKVTRLRPETLDPDYLEERARAMLGYTHENEVIVIEAEKPGN
mgnify:CR=1 FL=1